MPRERDFNRIDRVASTVKRALAQPLGELARSAGAGLVTITGVDVSPDLRHARVALSVFDGGGEGDDFVAGLAAHAAALQAVLGRELRTRRTPVLSFERDEAIARADRIQRLLDDRRVED
ncbi:MAG: 30S ribosome-binding factor RbfA [Gammaproteobacteria bacterium]|nr:30S ribosome-binding factor RbfA [Gammaproteobacteria bacterium]